MTINVTKPSVNLREKLNELETNKGLKGNEILQAETAQEVRSLIGAGRKNLIINGGMQVAQRGTSFTAYSGYTLDRYKGFGHTYNRIDNGDFYSLRMLWVSGTDANIYHPVELKKGQLENGQTYTLSFKYKSSGSPMTLEIFYRTGTAGANVVSQISVQTLPNSSGFSEYSITFTCTGRVAAQTALNIRFGNGGGTKEIANVQLELGSVATDFEHRSYGEELALCQRYFEKSYAQGVSPGTGGRTGMVGSGGTQGQTTTTEVGGGSNPFAVEKRTTPTMTYYDNAGAAGKVERLNAGIAWSSNNVNGQPFNPNTRSHSFISASGATASGVYAHFTADAEL